MKMFISYLLVFMQFVSLGLLFWPLKYNSFNNGLVFSLTCLILALIILIWTSKHNRLGNFNIVPEIKDGCELIQTGPYRFVRHPMYTSVVLIGISAVLYGFVVWKITVLAILMFVLYLKAKREEGLWCEKDFRYKSYQSKTKMFIPFIL